MNYLIKNTASPAPEQCMYVTGMVKFKYQEPPDIE